MWNIALKILSKAGQETLLSEVTTNELEELTSTPRIVSPKAIEIAKHRLETRLCLFHENLMGQVPYEGASLTEKIEEKSSQFIQKLNPIFHTSQKTEVKRPPLPHGKAKKDAET